ncbi:DUF4236 domain-containing protein [Ruminiclostridium herbifermentans]|uniref:DUF4236 domain-containing protein n=1 Tax=Ruminiclostridium herbifermentans TaxID=2488810 RepID=A0A4V6EN97_9FIRM|nr:DUF4236 domain-containing protein [Ruminiclostridium herbifermentans]QNU65895.1 DUF4236 domain-containing protein [Ruminiclostridium herbifermentans]
MGFRYRKSINLGGGFRVNLSKSGVGYSWGTKGYRVTKKAGGGTRKTYSIPGTGLSWTSDSGKGNNKSRSRINNSLNASSYASPEEGNVVYQASDANVKDYATDNTQEFLAAIKKYSLIRAILIWTIVVSAVLMTSMPLMIILTILGISGLIYLRTTQKIHLDYDFDEYGNRRIQMLNQAMEYLCKTKMAWQIDTINANSSTKIHAGAAHSVKRKVNKFKKKTPYFLKTDAICYHVKLRKDNVFILPDRLIVKGKKGWGVIEYSDLNIRVENQVFVESGTVAKDATVIGHAWQYVNKNGGPDKRFKNNRQLPECNYGKIMFQSSTGFNAIIYISNLSNAEAFSNTVSAMIDEAKQARIQEEQEIKHIKQSDDLENIYSAEEITSGKQEKLVSDEVNDSFDANSFEQEILNAFKTNLIDANLPLTYKCKRQNDGTTDIIYKGTKIGSMSLFDDKGWISYKMGANGKWNQVEGDLSELVKHVRKWIRYISNYLN